jgi:hypothetical protein
MSAIHGRLVKDFGSVAEALRLFNRAQVGSAPSRLSRVAGNDPFRATWPPGYSCGLLSYWPAAVSSQHVPCHVPGEREVAGDPLVSALHRPG